MCSRGVWWAEATPAALLPHEWERELAAGVASRAHARPRAGTIKAPAPRTGARAHVLLPHERERECGVRHVCMMPRHHLPHERERVGPALLPHEREREGI